MSVDNAWANLLEKDDRTSPEEYPEMCLIAKAELADYIADAVEAERERIAASVERLDNTMMHQDKLAKHIRSH